MVESVRDELNSGLSQGWMFLYSSGNMSTLNPKMNEIPMTKVFLASSFVVRIICIPAITMKLVTNTRIAPITGCGMIEKRAESLGKKAIRIKRDPAPNPIRRLVAPVAADTPTLLEDFRTAPYLHDGRAVNITLERVPSEHQPPRPLSRRHCAGYLAR